MGEYVGGAEAAEVWAAALEALQAAMPAATFQTWLQDSRALGFDQDVLTVGLLTETGVEWVKGRLWAQVERAVDRAFDQRGMPRFSLGFVVAPPGELVGGPEGEQPDPAPFLSVELVEFDPLKRGYVQASSYAVRFWLPYLGQGPFCTWLVLRSFAYQVESYGGEWPALPTVADILQIDRQRLIGRRRRGSWQPGWLQTLEQERVIWYGRGARGRYMFRVLTSLPLLTVQQVERLPESCRDAHARWLEQADLDLQEWQRMTVPTLVVGTSP